LPDIFPVAGMGGFCCFMGVFCRGFGKSECRTWFFDGEVVVIRWHNVVAKRMVFDVQNMSRFKNNSVENPAGHAVG
jgi:hypothetical protein